MHDDILEALCDIEQRIARRSDPPNFANQSERTLEHLFLDREQTRHALIRWLHRQPKAEHRLASVISSFTITITTGSVALFSLLILNSYFLVPMTANLHQIVHHQPRSLALMRT